LAAQTHDALLMRSAGNRTLLLEITSLYN
ncbi:uncharacterized protein METZ01_LOCUS332511, partial [marine metagenome]